MAEEFLTLMADLDDESQSRMSTWHDILKNAGHVGTQTPGLPYHISLATYPLELEQDAAERMKRACAAFAPFPVHISHIGLFAGGRVLFGAPERSLALDALRDVCVPACGPAPDPTHPWTPHVTLLIDEPAAVHAALPLLLRSFQPFVGLVTRLHLCAFWPTREIASAPLAGDSIAGDSIAGDPITGNPQTSAR